MSKKAPKAPAAPDPFATAAAQGAANEAAARTAGIINNPNQVTPFGTLTYTEGPGGEKDRYTATVALSPAEQAQLDLQNRIDAQLGQLGESQLGRVQGAINTPFDYSGLPELPADASAYRKQMADALYGRLEPQLQQDEERLRTRLAAQGTQIGNEGYNAELDRLDRARNDARLAVEAQAGNEASRTLQDQMALRNLGTQERQFARNLPLQELSQLVYGQGAPQTPTFTPFQGQGVGAAPISDAIYNNYNAQLGRYNQRLGQQSAGLGGLFGLAGSIGGGLLGGPFGASLGGLLGGGRGAGSMYRAGPWGGG